MPIKQLFFSLINVHKRIALGLQTLEIFANTQWEFDNKNILEIRKRLNSIERKLYKISSEGVDVEKYIENCVIGAHEYLIKRDAENDFFIKGKNLVRFVSISFFFFLGCKIFSKIIFQMYIVDKMVKFVFIAILISCIFKIFSS